MPNYGNQKYWDKRYSNKPGETFDWLEDYNSLRSLLVDNIEAIRKKQNDPQYNPLILNLGCGNSTVCEYMYDEGFTNIVNIDISSVCIAQMQKRNQETRPQMKFQVMDALNMEFPDDTFDLVIDKSTLDAILCGKQSFLNASKMVFEIQRILKQNGIYMMISYGEPNTRLLHISRSCFYFHINFFSIERSVEWIENENDEQQKNSTLIHYIYICQKLPSYDKLKAVSELKEIQQKMIEEEEKEKQMFPKMFLDSDDQESDYEDRTESSQQDFDSLFKRNGYEDSNEMIEQLIQQNILDKKYIDEKYEDQLFEQLCTDIQAKPDYHSQFVQQIASSQKQANSSNQQ